MASLEAETDEVFYTKMSVERRAEGFSARVSGLQGQRRENVVVCQGLVPPGVLPYSCALGSEAHSPGRDSRQGDPAVEHMTFLGLLFIPFQGNSLITLNFRASNILTWSKCLLLKIYRSIQ